MPKLKTYTSDEVVAMREKRRMTQSQFWSPLGVTQSTASRYEHGRSIPRAVQRLLLIAYGTERQCQGAVDELRTN